MDGHLGGGRTKPGRPERRKRGKPLQVPLLNIMFFGHHHSENKVEQTQENKTKGEGEEETITVFKILNLNRLVALVIA